MADSMFPSLIAKLQEYKKKYYLNGLIKGLIFFLTLTASAYVIITILEYYGKYNSFLRFFFLFSYITLTGIGLVKWIIIPLAGLLALKKQITDEKAAEDIGRYFPEVQDKLLNTLQLRNLAESENIFIQASISQKAKELSVVPFGNAINIKENKKYSKYLVVPFLFIAGILLILPEIFTESTARIINYEKTYTFPAPFTFKVLNNKLSAFRNEDFDLNLGITGKAVPEQVYLYINGRKAKMKKNPDGSYSYNFRGLQQTESLRFEAAGYSSVEYLLEVFARPDLKNLEIELNYPAYLKKKSEKLSNVGNLNVPEGTLAQWNINTGDVEKLYIDFPDSVFKDLIISSESNEFNFSKKLVHPFDYKLLLENKFGKGKEKIAYHVNIIPDQFPAITAEDIQDSTLFSYITFAGSATDDYGISRLRLFFRKINKENKGEKFHSTDIKIRAGEVAQNFLHTWKLDSLDLKPGDKLEYYLQVWDNDGVNGAKSTKSRIFSLSLPDKEAINKEISADSKSAEKSMNSLLDRSKKLKKELEKFDEKIKTKPNLDWQDKKSLEELMNKHQQLNKDIEETQKEHKELSEKLEKFNNPDEALKEKMEQLQALMEQLLDEETKKLYEELEKMLKENAGKEELQKMLEEIKQKDKNMEKELDRSLEWFKQIQFEQKAEEIKNDLKNLAEEQKKLADQTQNKKENKEELLKQQDNLNNDFKKLEEELKDLDKLNESLENKNELKDFTKEQQDIKNSQQKGTEQLQNNQNKKAGESQKEAGEKMEEMAEMMAQMQSESSQEQLQENMDDLRAILDNLVKLSFEQEDLMKNFKKVNQSDPRYLELSQKQLKLKDDSRIIEDSLNALAKRVFQIQTFITRELTEMNGHMDASIKNIRDRRPEQATANQQYTMTSVNNLALMLNDVLKQMQQQMAQQMNSKGGGQCKKPGKNKGQGLGEMQKQLNEKLNQMKNGQKPGESMSKELAKMAAQQEMIRNALKELQKKAGGGTQAGKELSEIMKQMEQTEKDLVNKRISQETVMRQKEILTRLLEAEKSARERDTDKNRESNTGKDLNRNLPPDLEKYLKEKEKQTELLKTVNPAFTPYYKKEVNEYFQKIEK
jgi:hypothetical protein